MLPHRRTRLLAVTGIGVAALLVTTAVLIPKDSSTPVSSYPIEADSESSSLFTTTSSLTSLETIPLPTQSLNPFHNEANNIGSAGLLPWKTEELPKVEKQEADGPQDEAASSTDKAVLLYETLERENSLAQEATLKLPAAKTAAVQAQDEARRATTYALSLRTEATTAEGKRDGAIRGLYMTGGSPSLAGVLFADSGGEAFDILVTYEQANTATSHTINAATELRRRSVAADAAAVAAMKASDAANLVVTDLEEQIKIHSAAAMKASRAYTEYLSLTGPQMEIGSDGCPLSVAEGTLRGGSDAIGVTALCQRSVALASSPQAALAIKWAFSKLGAPYACKGIGRMAEWRFDCSSLTSRAYAEGAGLPFINSGNSHTTRNMMPWDGYSLDPHYEAVSPELVSPGDLILTRSCTNEPCIYQHVTMALSDGYILQTNSCGDVAHITLNPGYGADAHFVVARRVILLPGETIPASILATQAGSSLSGATVTGSGGGEPVSSSGVPEVLENSPNRPHTASEDILGGGNSPAAAG